MVVCEKEYVVNVKHGGFCLDTEMALWLMTNRNWVVVLHDDWQKNKPYCDLIEMTGDYFFPPNDSPAFRSNQDLIDCVREVQRLHANDTYPDSYYGHNKTLRVVRLTVEVAIDNMHAGIEKVSSWSYTSGD